MRDKVQQVAANDSIHAPPNRKERPPGCLAQFFPTSCFNPRPSQPEGATPPGFGPSVMVLVSIHAPPNRKERQARLARVLAGQRVSIHAPPNRKERHNTAL